ncbi:MAG: Kazal-type serine protease inhibitor family protein [Candidatus Micrarchaeota archaeon]
MKGLMLVFGIMILLAGCTNLLKCPNEVVPVCGSDGITYPNECLAKQAGVQVSATGECANQNNCVDTDGGKDLFNKGVATSTNGSVFSDNCKGIQKVSEAYCELQTAKSEEFFCPTGYVCENGACKEAECSDSDGGKTIGVKGTVIESNNTSIDSCVDSNTLKEYYCNNTKIESENIACGAGNICENGICKEATCADSDGGKDEMEKGTATKGSISQSDSCSGSSAVKEYYCENNSVKNEIIDCDSGYECASGECVEITCVDSDGGKDKMEKGTTTYGTETGIDSCYSDTQVIEYYCASQTSISYEKINCGSGYECYNGECQEVQCQKDEEDLEEEDKRYNIKSFDENDELVLYEDQIVEINDEMFLKVDSVETNSTTFLVYEDYEALLDDDELCSETLDVGESGDDFCGENTDTVELVSVDEGDGMAEVAIDEYHAVQYYSYTGIMVDWTEDNSCLDDELLFYDYDSYFYPYLDTESSGLNLDGKKFYIFGTLAEIVEVTSDSFTFEIDGDEYEVEDGDDIEYFDEDYEFSLDFNDGGLYRIRFEPS